MKNNKIIRAVKLDQPHIKNVTFMTYLHSCAVKKSIMVMLCNAIFTPKDYFTAQLCTQVALPGILSI